MIFASIDETHGMALIAHASISVILVAGGAAAIGVAAAWAFLFPAIRKTRYLHQEEIQ